MFRMKWYGLRGKLRWRRTRKGWRQNRYRRLAVEPLEACAAPGETFMALVGVTGVWGELPWLDPPGGLQVTTALSSEELLAMAEQHGSEQVARTAAWRSMDVALALPCNGQSAAAAESVPQEAEPVGVEPDVLDAARAQRGARDAQLPLELLDDLLDLLLLDPLAALASSAEAALAAGVGSPGPGGGPVAEPVDVARPASSTTCPAPIPPAAPSDTALPPGVATG